MDEEHFLSDAADEMSHTSTHEAEACTQRAESIASSTGARAGSDAPLAGSGYSIPYIWYVVFLLSIVNVFNLMDRMALSVLAPAIKADLKLSDGQLGVLTGVAFAVFYAVCGVPIARWADRGVRRNIVALALATWSAMTALSGAAQNFWHLFLARVGVGAGEAGGLAPAQAILCDYVPLKWRSGAFAIHTLGLTTGMMVGLALSGWLADIAGWRWAFVLLGLPGLALAALVRFSVREPVRGSLDAVRDDGRNLSLVQTVAALWKCRTYKLLAGMLVASGFATNGLFQWWPSFYARQFALSSSTIGISLGVALGVGAGVGMLVGGIIGAAGTQRDASLPLKVGAVAILLALPVAIASLTTSSVTYSMILGAAMVMLLNIPSAPVVASTYSIVAPRMRATAGALTIFCQSVLGFGLGPLCVGLVSDALMPSLGAASLRYALFVPIALFVVMAAFLYAAAGAVKDDLRASAAQENDGG